MAWNREVRDGPSAKSPPSMASTVSRLTHFEVTLGKCDFFCHICIPVKQALVVLDYSCKDDQRKKKKSEIKRNASVACVLKLKCFNFGQDTDCLKKLIQMAKIPSLVCLKTI